MHTDARFEIQRLPLKNGTAIDHRITDMRSDSRVATCYDPDNARMVCDALNAFIAPVTATPGTLSEPRIDAQTLAQLIKWSHGYLKHKRTVPLPIPASDIETHNLSIDLWSGMLCALSELQERRAGVNSATKAAIDSKLCEASTCVKLAAAGDTKSLIAASERITHARQLLAELAE